MWWISSVSCIVMMYVVCASLCDRCCLLVVWICLLLVIFCLGGVSSDVGVSFRLFACVGVDCCVGFAVCFRTCALVSAPACGLAAHTNVGPGFDSTSPAKSNCSASHRT